MPASVEGPREALALICCTSLSQQVLVSDARSSRISRSPFSPPSILAHRCCVCAGGACCPNRRGEWWVRLSINTEHLGRTEQSLEVRDAAFRSVSHSLVHSCFILYARLCSGAVPARITTMLRPPYKELVACADMYRCAFCLPA